MKMKLSMRFEHIMYVKRAEDACIAPGVIDCNHFVTFPPQGFFIRGDLLKQHHEYMPQNAVLMRELPANFSETQLMELFQGLQLEDGSPCPVPIPEKIRSEGLAWYV